MSVNKKNRRAIQTFLDLKLRGGQVGLF